MKEGMKLNPAIVEKIGETQTQRLADKMDEVNAKFTQALLETFDRIVKEARDSCEEFTSHPELAEHRELVTHAMRDSVLDQLSCSLIAFSAETTAELNGSYADFAAHAMGHLESAYRDKNQRMVLGSLSGVLRGLIPPDVQERLSRAKRDEDKPAGG